MLRTGREREERALSHVPPRERLEHRLEELAPDSAIPEIGPDGQRAEEAERAPACREHRSDHLSVDHGDPGTVGSRSISRPHTLAVAEGRTRIGESTKRAERHTHDAIRSVEIAGKHQPYEDGTHGRASPCGNATRTPSHSGAAATSPRLRDRKPDVVLGERGRRRAREVET